MIHFMNFCSQINTIQTGTFEFRRVLQRLGFLDQVVVEAVKALFGEEKEENLSESLTTIMNCCDGEKTVTHGLAISDALKVTSHSGF